MGKVKIKKPRFLGIKNYKNFPLKELVPYIDWTFFFHAWDLTGKYPRIFNHPEKGKEAKELFDNANVMLNRIVSENWIKANAVIGLHPANSKGDNILIYDNEKDKNIAATFYCLRQQLDRGESKNKRHNLSLADYIAPVETGLTDYIGTFALTVGLGIEEKVKEFENQDNDYDAIMLKILADRFAEALSERLHEIVRKELWGFAPDENISIEEMLRVKYQGIRPAFGYPACPDHSEKRTLFDLLDAEKNTGMFLTENFSMYPAASVSGLYFSYPDAKYFNVGKIKQDQSEDYAERKNIDIELAVRYLSFNLE